jgi:AcrR family transcriptional regulator
MSPAPRCRRRSSRVAERAGIAAGIYRYFPSKDDLVAALVAVIAEQEIAAIRRPAAAAPGPLSALAAAIQAFAVRALRERRLTHDMLAGAAEADAAAERLGFRRRLAAELATHIRAAIAAGHLPEQDAEFAAAAVIGVVMEGLLGPLSGESGTAEARHGAAQALTLFALRALGVVEGRTGQWRREARLEQAVLGGQSLALCGGLETIDGSLGSGARLVALDVHPGRRQAVQDRRRDHGIEGKGDTGDVGLERGPDRNGEVGRAFYPQRRKGRLRPNPCNGLRVQAHHRRGRENSPSRPYNSGVTVVDRPTISGQFLGRFHSHFRGAFRTRSRCCARRQRVSPRAS